MDVLISQKVYMKSFFISQIPHKFVNLFFLSLVIKEELTGLCGT